MKPTGKSKKAYESGYRARKKNVPIDNLPLYLPVTLASWWVAGWNDADMEGK